MSQSATALQKFLGPLDAAAVERVRAEVAKAIDLAEIDVTAHAMSGHFEPFAKYIKTGGAIGSISRDLLASILRGELRFKPGNRRTYAQRMTEWRAQEAVRGFQRCCANSHGSRGSRARAIRHYLEMHPNMGEETLKKYLKKGGGGLSKHELRIIDEARAKVNAEIEAEQAAGRTG